MSRSDEEILQLFTESYEETKLTPKAGGYLNKEENTACPIGALCQYMRPWRSDDYGVGSGYNANAESILGKPASWVTGFITGFDFNNVIGDVWGSKDFLAGFNLGRVARRRFLKESQAKPEGFASDSRANEGSE